MLDLIPAASVGHIGLYRDPETLEAIKYYYKVPKDMGGRLTIVVDPMLATGHTAVAALDLLKRAGAREVSFVCLVAAPEGIAELRRTHPEDRKSVVQGKSVSVRVELGGRRNPKTKNHKKTKKDKN